MKVAGVLVLANVTIKGANFGGLERRKNVVPIRSTFKVCRKCCLFRIMMIPWMGSDVILTRLESIQLRTGMSFAGSASKSALLWKATVPMLGPRSISWMLIRKMSLGSLLPT
jgi:hypothetical protein